MLGRGVGSALPALVIAGTIKFGSGKIFKGATEEIAPHELATSSLFTSRTAIGINLVEASAAGLATGALLSPTDDAKARSLTSFVEDRAQSGLAGALTYSTLALSAIGLQKSAEMRFLNDGEVGKSLGKVLGKTLANPVAKRATVRRARRYC